VSRKWNRRSLKLIRKQQLALHVRYEPSLTCSVKSCPLNLTLIQHTFTSSSVHAVSINILHATNITYGWQQELRSQLLPREICRNRSAQPTTVSVSNFNWLLFSQELKPRNCNHTGYFYCYYLPALVDSYKFSFQECLYCAYTIAASRPSIWRHIAVTCVWSPFLNAPTAVVTCVRATFFRRTWQTRRE
jgi:hypothetical protein